jgi:hypothetical protein
MYQSTTDPQFLATLESWFSDQADILVLIRRSHAAGSKDFEFYRSFQELANRIRELPARTCVTCFRQRQLPLRGIVDDQFIETCLASIPDGLEYLLVETVKRTYGRQSWFHDSAGESHAELRGDLDDARGMPVAVGPYPDWLEDTDDVISAVVQNADGIVQAGVY